MFGNNSEEKLKARWSKWNSEYSAKGNRYLKEQLAILVEQEAAAINNRSFYSAVIALIVGLFALGATFHGFNDMLLKGALIVFAMLCVYWLYKIYSYGQQNVTMRKQIIKLILAEREKRAHEKKTNFKNQVDDIAIILMRYEGLGKILKKESS